MHQNIRAIVIDDDLLQCEVTKRQLTAMGMEVRTATCADAGVEMACRLDPDVILLAQELRDLDGISLCRQFASAAATVHIPVLLLAKSRRVHGSAFEAGAADCLTRPFSDDELRARINRALGGTLAASPGPVEISLAETQQPQEAASLTGEQQRLQEAMAACDEALAVIAHELRTPLTGLRVMSEYLLSDRSAGEPHRFINAMHDEVIRLSNMVNNLLESARINSGAARWRWTTVSLDRQCRDAINLVAPLSNRAVTLNCDVQPPDLSMNGDADAINRLVLNLLSNAQRHTTEGSISVTAREVFEDAHTWIDLCVSDTGSGVTPEAMSKIGVPFALNSGAINLAQTGGNGLGLSICRSIVAAHGGSLTVQSTFGEGTTIRVRLRADLPGAVTHVQSNQDAVEEMAA